MSYKLILPLATLALIYLNGGSGTAAIVDVTYTGQVVSGPGLYTGAKSYSAYFVLDTSSPTAHSVSGPTSVSVYGGTEYLDGSTNPILSARVSIGTDSYVLTPTTGLVISSRTASDSEQYHKATNATGSEYLIQEILTSPPALPLTISDAFTYSVMATDNPKGSFCGLPGCFILRPSSLTESLHVTEFVTATPLPAALPLFAGGLGVLGLFAARRRKGKGATAPATS